MNKSKAEKLILLEDQKDNELVQLGITLGEKTQKLKSFKNHVLLFPGDNWMLEDSRANIKIDFEREYKAIQDKYRKSYIELINEK